MFQTQIEALKERQGNKYLISRNEISLTYQDFIDLLKRSAEFRSFYTSLLKEAPFQAYFWEQKAMTAASLDTPYEFVLVNSPSLARVSADRNSFARKFSQESSVVSFKNLGRDASLIVPCPADSKTDFPHLASFLRSAIEDQIQDFWKEVGRTYEADLGESPKWLSTSGLGVYWLHVRVDSRPKYYTYSPYRQFP
ncbi:MAG: hypothetical protein R8P61_01050 [Bacteroidia bacterium]|nr:hypothetical protein [Bacteroidia bacterium]